MEVRRISRTGGSMTLSLPKPFCTLMSLVKGTDVAVTMPVNDVIIIQRLDTYHESRKGKKVYGKSTAS